MYLGIFFVKFEGIAHVLLLVRRLVIERCVMIIIPREVVSAKNYFCTQCSIFVWQFLTMLFDDLLLLPLSM